MAPTERRVRFLEHHEILVSRYEALSTATQANQLVDIGFLPDPVDSADRSLALHLDDHVSITPGVAERFGGALSRPAGSLPRLLSPEHTAASITLTAAPAAESRAAFTLCHAKHEVLLRTEDRMKDRHRGSAMFMRSMMLVPVVAMLAATALTGPADVAVSPEPSREDLQNLLLDAEDLPETTGKVWMAGTLVTTGPSGPAGTSESSGCPGMDNAVLALNTGLTDSGVQPFYSASGDFLEETVVYDRAARQHVDELRGAIEQCPAMKFSDGPAVTLQQIDLGPSVAGFRSYIGSESQSAVIVAEHGDYVVELVMSDDGYTDATFQKLLQTAFAEIDNPR